MWFFKTSTNSLENKDTSHGTYLSTTVWILSNQHLQGNEMQSKDQDFFKVVICGIIRLFGNYNALWESLQIEEKFTELNIHYFPALDTIPQCFCHTRKHYLLSNNIRRNTIDLVLGMLHREEQDLGSCWRMPFVVFSSSNEKDHDCPPRFYCSKEIRKTNCLTYWDCLLVSFLALFSHQDEHS